MSGFKVNAAKRPPVDPAKLAAFASGAESAEQAAPGTMPWAGLDDKKRAAAFSMRFTARELAILKHMASVSPESMHEICLAAVRQKLDEFVASHQTM